MRKSGDCSVEVLIPVAAAAASNGSTCVSLRPAHPQSPFTAFMAAGVGCPRAAHRALMGGVVMEARAPLGLTQFSAQGRPASVALRAVEKGREEGEAWRRRCVEAYTVAERGCAGGRSREAAMRSRAERRGGQRGALASLSASDPVPPRACASQACCCSAVRVGAGGVPVVGSPTWRVALRGDRV